MPKGESRREGWKFVPNTPRPTPTLLDPDNYQVKLVNKGKNGEQGWMQKNPKKYPSRMVTFEVEGQEDELTGKPVTVRKFFSASPAALGFVWDLALAANIQRKDLEIKKLPQSPKDTKLVREVCSTIDAVLDEIIDNDEMINVYIDNEENKGNTYNAITKFQAPDDVTPEAEKDEDEDEDEETDDLDEEADETEDEDEKDEDDAPPLAAVAGGRRKK